MDKSCPKCGSEKTALLSVIYEGQVGYSQAKVTAIGIDSGGMAIGGGNIEKTSITALGKRFAPPEEPTVKPVHFVFSLVLAMGLLSCLLGYIVSSKSDAEYQTTLIYFFYSLGAILILVAIGAIYHVKETSVKQYKLAMKKYSPKMEKWKKEWGCLQCGTSYLPK